MLYTGPWDLSQFPDVDFGVQILPKDLNHQTIAGPDNWVLFNNGDERAQAAFDFMKWWTAPQQLLEWSTKTGDLPTKQSVQDLPGYADYTAKYDGIAEFVANLKNAIKVRPVIAAVSEDLGGHGPGDSGGAAGQEAAAGGARPGGRQVNAILASAGRAVQVLRLLRSEHTSGWLFVAPALAVIAPLRADCRSAGRS